ncbi:hypothetical protein K488DRAFT_71676 [Vararia minispora EC-137]|uniref:Uncharacterized protein n=1 Tax=Vararia minispora EC-137 TaxID=1314806 RepID=A0ACB8QH10_9AGAM|nr:hypothetical protein K488DRAFT_71676 [Vararia minispora EC-137]
MHRSYQKQEKQKQVLGVETRAPNAMCGYVRHGLERAVVARVHAGVGTASPAGGDTDSGEVRGTYVFHETFRIDGLAGGDGNAPSAMNARLSSLRENRWMRRETAAYSGGGKLRGQDAGMRRTVGTCRQLFDFGDGRFLRSLQRSRGVTAGELEPTVKEDAEHTNYSDEDSYASTSFAVQARWDGRVTTMAYKHSPNDGENVSANRGNSQDETVARPVRQELGEVRNRAVVDVKGKQTRKP